MDKYGKKCEISNEALGDDENDEKEKHFDHDISIDFEEADQHNHADYQVS